MKKKLFQVYGTMFSFVTTTVEAESIEEANEIAYGAGGWMEEGSDFELSKDMTEELIEEDSDQDWFLSEVSYEEYFKNG